MLVDEDGLGSPVTEGDELMGDDAVVLCNIETLGEEATEGELAMLGEIEEDDGDVWAVVRLVLEDGGGDVATRTCTSDDSTFTQYSYFPLAIVATNLTGPTLSLGGIQMKSVAVLLVTEECVTASPCREHVTILVLAGLLVNVPTGTVDPSVFRACSRMPW